MKKVVLTLAAEVVVFFAIIAGNLMGNKTIVTAGLIMFALIVIGPAIMCLFDVFTGIKLQIEKYNKKKELCREKEISAHISEQVKQILATMQK